MKNTKKLCLTLLLCVVGALCAVLAACGGKTVKFTFDTMGGTEIAAENVVKGEEYTLPVPEYSGYGFEGWYLSEDYSGNPVEKVVPEKDTTFYAKWSKLYAINLELDGGSLSQSTLYLKEGAVVYDFMQDYAPTKSGLQFGAWYDGNSELAKNKRMPAEAITLTAKYKVEYTVELYTEKLDGSDYEKVLDDVKGYEFVGATYEAEYKQNGFREINHENSVVTKVLSATASENVLKLYFDREVYTVTFNPNLPDGTASQTTSVSVKYGAEVELPFDYTADGYCLEGWSTSASGSVEYKVDYIANKLYGGQGASEAVKFSPERNVTLYAVWNKGYIDLFGGTDSMFLFADEADAIYLLRGGMFFKGSYNADKSTFVFEREDEEILLEGKIVNSDAFCYYSAAREQMSYVLFVNGSGANTNVTIYFDEYNGVQYSERNSQGKTEVSTGTYVIEESGEYTVTYTDGPLSGQTMTIRLTTGSVNGIKSDVFTIRNDEQYGKVLTRFLDDNRYYPKVYQITLTGYGMATINLGSQTASYFAKVEDGFITLINVSTGATYLTARLVDMNGTAAYIVYDEELSGEFTTDDGATVTLDGCYLATYEKDGVSFQANFSVSESYTNGGTIISFSNGSDEYRFSVSGKTLTAVTSTVIEYNYAAGSSIYYAPLLAQTEDGSYYLYGMYVGPDSNRVFQKVSKGTVTDYDKISGVKVYTATETYDNQASTAVVNGTASTFNNLNEIKQFAFILNETNGTFSTDWTEAVKDGAQLFSAEYPVTNGAKIVVYGPFAAYQNNGQTTIGTFSYDNSWDVYEFAASSGNIYFYIDEYGAELEDGTELLELTSKPYVSIDMNSVLAKMFGLASCRILFYGDGSAYVLFYDSSNQAVGSLYGLYEETDETSLTGAPICHFILVNSSYNVVYEFDYIELYTSSATYFTMFDEDYSGEFISENDGVLTLDGFGYMAQYRAANGTTGTFRYMTGTNLVALIIDGDYRFFDVDLEEKTFTLRGAEFGSNFGEYYVFENRGMNGYVFLVDGYGNAEVYDITGDTPVCVDENATYTADGDEYTVNYTNGSKTVTVVGVLGYVRLGSSTVSAFFTVRETVVQSYIDTQTWAVYAFDELGNMTVYSRDGEKYTGTYTIVTDELLFIVSSDAGIQSLFTYSVADATVTPVSYTVKAYFTENLESFLFNKAGYSVYRGKTYYYNDNDQGETIIYSQDFSNEQANEYGMVAENLGVLGNTITRDEKTYYANAGFAVQFTRKEEGKDKYPVKIGGDKKPFETLTFAPNGADKFTVNGAVVIDGTQYACKVTREVDSNDNVSIYFKITNTNYRVDVNVSYKGVDDGGNSLSTYEVTALSQVQELMSEKYVNNVLYYMMGMADPFPDNDGTMTFKIEYDEDGEMTADYVNVNLIEEYGYTDLNGDAFVLNKVTDYAYSSANMLYIINFVGSDGYDYCLRARVTQNQFFGMYTYTIYALTRVQTLTNGDFEVEVEKVVYSESGISADRFYNVSLKKNGAAIVSTDAYIEGNTIYYMVRELDDNKKITSTVYYKIDFAVDEQVEADVSVFSGVTVTELQTTTTYAENGTDFVDVVDGIGVKFIVLNNRAYLIKECSYDDATETYTATSTSDKKFSVKITAGVAEITEIVEEEVEDNQ